MDHIAVGAGLGVEGVRMWPRHLKRGAPRASDHASAAARLVAAATPG